MITATLNKLSQGNYTLEVNGILWDVFQNENGEWNGSLGNGRDYLDPQPTRYDVISGITGWDVADAMGRKQNGTVKV